LELTHKQFITVKRSQSAYSLYGCKSDAIGEDHHARSTQKIPEI